MPQADAGLTHINAEASVASMNGCAGSAMIAIVLMLLLLIGSYLALGGLVYFCEDLIAPAPPPSLEHPAEAADGKGHRVG
jgi:hypothetical protein